MNVWLMVVKGLVRTHVRTVREATCVDAQFLDTNCLMMISIVKVILWIKEAEFIKKYKPKLNK